MSGTAKSIVTDSGTHHELWTDPKSSDFWVHFFESNSAEPPEGRVLSHLPGSKLYLRCPPGEQFQFGVPGYATSMDELICRLRAHAEDRRPARTTLFGHGPAAYTALLAGSIVTGAHFVAIHPARGATSAANHPWWGDIDSALGLMPGRQNGVTLLSAWDPMDAGFLGRPPGLLPAFGTVVEVLTRFGGLAYLGKEGLAGLLLEGVDALKSFNEKKLLFPAFTNGTREQYAHHHQTYLLASKRDASKGALLRATETFRSWKNPGWQHQRATILRKLGHIDQALAAIELVVAKAPDTKEYCVTFAKVAVLTKDEALRKRAQAMLLPFSKTKGIPDLVTTLEGDAEPPQKGEGVKGFN